MADRGGTLDLGKPLLMAMLCQGRGFECRPTAVNDRQLLTLRFWLPNVWYEGDWRKYACLSPFIIWQKIVPQIEQISISPTKFRFFIASQWIPINRVGRPPDHIEYPDFTCGYMRQCFNE
ncbi:hypothetical protein IP65_14865 [Novosphingobium sp. AAP1]|nr:hypothetical protein IP65_14865 [Novosphingobium sp. AAP1]